MAAVDARRQEEFGISLKEIDELMETRGAEALAKIAEHGGVLGICQKLRTSPSEGLTGGDADLERRRRAFGGNTVPQVPSKSFLRLVWEALQDTTLIVLEVAALVSLGLSLYPDTARSDRLKSAAAVWQAQADEGGGYDWIEGVAILVSVAVVVLVTAGNDFTKERQFRGLQRRVADAHALSVLRAGAYASLPVAELVVGDICTVKYGDLVPADGLLLEGNELRLDESSLTGESRLVRKSPALDPTLLSGTRVMEGAGVMLTLGVGEHSQAGAIFALLARRTQDTEKTAGSEMASNAGTASPAAVTSSKKERSVLQGKLTKLAIHIGYAGSTIAGLTVMILVVHFCVKTFAVEKRPWQDSFVNEFVHHIIIGVTVLVVAVPEGLPLAVTLSLAYSVKKMIADNILVRHLDACETMGNATTVCSDKTGTLTTNCMTAVAAFVCAELHSPLPSRADLPAGVVDLLTLAIAVNTSYAAQLPQEEGGKGSGNPTELALLGLVRSLGTDYAALRAEHPERGFAKVYTFNSQRKAMATAIPRGRAAGPGFTLFAKGASEIMLLKCSFVLDAQGALQRCNALARTALGRDVIAVMAADGLRTIAVAYKEFVPSGPKENQAVYSGEPAWEDEENVFSGLTLLCVVGIEDPVRPEVPAAILACRRAGITVRMVTGDNVNTARSIATKCGILRPGQDFLVLEGKEFNRRIRDANGKVQQRLADLVWPQLRVLARSSPADKYALVTAIIESRVHAHREVVAVTGDGTNDAPALRRADVGFAMGIAGTEVAKEASDIIVTDDNFSSIVKAVIWGRNIYDSIGKFLQFQLTVNVVAVSVAFLGACAVQDSPLKAVQMLWVNLIMDTLASLALATEMPTPELLRRKPYGRTKPLLSTTMLKNIVGQAFFQLAVILTLLFAGAGLLDVGDGRGARSSQHYTVIFNAFVMMTLFNEINARKIHGQRNIFQGLCSNGIFCAIWLVTFTSQILIVEFGGAAFATSSLSLDQWMWCLFFGLGTLLWAQLVTSVPSRWIRVPSRCGGRRGTGPAPTSTGSVEFSTEPAEQEGPPQPAKILWVRGLTRVQTQLRVVNAFREGLDDRHENPLPDSFQPNDQPGKDSSNSLA